LAVPIEAKLIGGHGTYWQAGINHRLLRNAVHAIVSNPYFVVRLIVLNPLVAVNGVATIPHLSIYAAKNEQHASQKDKFQVIN
jgi:hypothetical protein